CSQTPVRSSQSSFLSPVFLVELLAELFNLFGLLAEEFGVFEWSVFELAVVPNLQVGGIERDAVDVQVVLDGAVDGGAAVAEQVFNVFKPVRFTDNLFGDIH